MRKKVLTVILAVTMLLSACIMSACSFWDKDVKVVLNNRGNIENTYTVSIFKNAVLADIKTEKVIGKTQVEENGEMKVKDVEFLGWHPDPGAEKGFYEGGDLVRLVEMQDYVHDGVLVLYAIYGVRVFEKHDLIIAWYGQAVSGLTTSVSVDGETPKQTTFADYGAKGLNSNMDKYAIELKKWLESNPETKGLDIVFRRYLGDVAASCTNLKKDGFADILFGWGGNLLDNLDLSQTEKEAIIRQNGINMGIKTNRYVDLMRKTEKMFDSTTSLSEKVWQWTIENAALFA